MKSFAYYLHGKQFVVETDHRNLLWMEKSEANIVIRWRVYLQSFNMLLRDIKGSITLSQTGVVGCMYCQVRVTSIQSRR